MKITQITKLTLVATATVAATIALPAIANARAGVPTSSPRRETSCAS
jgi:hypothetical protein